MGIFSGQTILVTGASGGIGEAVARALGKQGAMVCLTGRDRPRLRKLAGRIPGQKARCYPADLTIAKEVESVVKKILSDHEQLDALVHCAAIIALDAIATGSIEDFDRQFQTNVLGPFSLTQLLLPALIASQGQVVFTNSSAGLRARAGVSQYAATKHALKAVADSLREECNSAGVRVCSLFLGATATPMQAAVRAHQGRSYSPDRLMQPDDVAAFVAALLALPRSVEVT
ncbi:MAG: SDR family NAD(P)-dependent oxidoreductase, partial [Chthoniobacterales bacterium]